MNYKAIIFDMDGTIIETNHIWNQTNKDMLEARGIALSAEQEVVLFEQLQGLGLAQSCAILKEIGKLSEEVAELVKEKSQRACRMYAQEVRFINGFVQFHGKVVNHNLKHGIATNADDDTVHITNQKLNLKQFFGQHIYNISQVNFIGKPHPAIYLHAAHKLELDPRECIAIEDSSHGITAAKKAGMFCIGINSASNPQQLVDADMIINSYHDIDLQQLLTKK